jgi:hypothetical protein
VVGRKIGLERVKVCLFVNKQKLHWTQHMATLHSNACHNFEINNKQPCRFYSAATQMMSSVQTAVVVYKFNIYGSMHHSMN